LRDEFPR